jgi:hypothetical protein
MSGGDTTSILDLPTDPTGGGSIGGNVSFSINEKSSDNSQQISAPGMSLDQTTINQLVSGLQHASSTGLTHLQSRDIPRNTDGIIQDPSVQPNYIPPTPSESQDYIRDYQENEDIIAEYNKQHEQMSSIDQLYDEIQIPLLLCILYFLFQLPIFKRALFKYLPFLFFNDGNINIYGYLFTSVLFGVLYYILSKTTTLFGTF